MSEDSKIEIELGGCSGVLKFVLAVFLVCLAWKGCEVLEKYEKKLEREAAERRLEAK